MPTDLSKARVKEIRRRHLILKGEKIRNDRGDAIADAFIKGAASIRSRRMTLMRREALLMSHGDRRGIVYANAMMTHLEASFRKQDLIMNDNSLDSFVGDSTINDRAITEKRRANMHPPWSYADARTDEERRADVDGHIKRLKKEKMQNKKKAVDCK